MAIPSILISQVPVETVAIQEDVSGAVSQVVNETVILQDAHVHVSQVVWESVVLPSTAPVVTTTVNIPQVSGGGSGVKCRTSSCHPKSFSQYLGWGPLRIRRDRTGFYAVYQDSRNRVIAWQINPDADLITQLAAGVTQSESIHASYNNPAGIRIAYGQIDRTGSLITFPDFDTGKRAMFELIRNSLQGARREVL